ncbi:hypothetical protein LYSHEL_21940 [Lysobacter helvus]|uniref:DUF2785 domain-containing protein n=2 Tax=Lysobacteraceae TaxID=32033 RepID=A0ABM7Q770_9GAMM|nr:MULTISPECIES: DUF2785 domain-containing protein [Lysobacter]BCT93171.1 hypothetical protein LYSCAS_21950 [Lysobacter caseinilyticus]BCT96323.1 hypothetical protein LYSHEL_21940 [Lysobacter helvus]
MTHSPWGRALPLVILLPLLWPQAAPAFDGACQASAAPSATKVRDGTQNILSVDLRALVACLGDPDPALRDDVAYRALALFASSSKASPDLLRGLLGDLMPIAEESDGNSLARSFAILTLAELVRRDARAAWMTERERARVVASAGSFMGSVDDYRGFDETTGWHHSVAHGADLIATLASDPNVDADLLRRLLTPLASQVVPEEQVFYVHGEAERLAAAAVSLRRRGLISHPAWLVWLDTLQQKVLAIRKPGAMGLYLSRRHNLRLFKAELLLSGRGWFALDPDRVFQWD